ncbi:MAG: GntR family transcriptional regulator [Nakamurella sp.]
MTSNAQQGSPRGLVTRAAQLDTGTLPAQIHEFLEEAIIHGDLEPGTRLRPDKIAAEYGVSRIPVREALSSLQEAGWVDIRPRYGVYVRARNRTELRELFEARAGIEAEIARLAATRRAAEDIADLQSIVDQTKKAAQRNDVDRLSQASVAFNACIRRAAHNSVLESVSLSLEKRARFYFSPIAGLLGSDWVDNQGKLVALLAAGHIDAAGASARQHIIKTGEAVWLLLGAESFSD